jgi:hypothetical protein
MVVEGGSDNFGVATGCSQVVGVEGSGWFKTWVVPMVMPSDDKQVPGASGGIEGTTAAAEGEYGVGSGGRIEKN